VTSKKAEQIGGHPTTAPRSAATLRDEVATSRAPALPPAVLIDIAQVPIGVNSFEKAPFVMRTYTGVEMPALAATARRGGLRG
jgi:hypothetical protein